MRLWAGICHEGLFMKGQANKEGHVAFPLVCFLAPVRNSWSANDQFLASHHLFANALYSDVHVFKHPSLPIPRLAASWGNHAP